MQFAQKQHNGRVENILILIGIHSAYQNPTPTSGTFFTNSEKQMGRPKHQTTVFTSKVILRHRSVKGRNSRSELRKTDVSVAKIYLYG